MAKPAVSVRPLADRSLAPARVGRDGSLRLAFARRGGQTVLVERRFTLPLQFLEPIPLPDQDAVAVVLLNPTGGVAGGDVLDTELALGDGTHVYVTTPSATRVYATRGEPSVQRTRIHVGDGATLEYRPEHLIPHAGAWSEQSVRIDVWGQGRVLLCDAFATGRRARGERWAFRRLTNHLEIWRDQRPVFLDHVDLEPPAGALVGLGGLDGLDYLATLVAVDPRVTDWEEAVGELLACLGETGPVVAGASALARDGCCVRLLAPSAFELTARIGAVWTFFRRRLLGLGRSGLRMP